MGNPGITFKWDTCQLPPPWGTWLILPLVVDWFVTVVTEVLGWNLFRCQNIMGVGHFDVRRNPIHGLL